MSSMGTLKQIKPQSGFTIVELLIVIVIIGILAAIVMVAYTGVTNSAYEATAKSELASAMKQLDMYRVQNDDKYPSATPPSGLIKFSSSSYVLGTGAKNFYYCVSTDGKNVAIAVLAKDQKRYVNSSINGMTIMTHSWGGANVCTAGGIADPSTARIGYDGRVTPIGIASWLELLGS